MKRLFLSKSASSLIYMILIISQKNHEPSTLDVQEWLDFYKADYERVNGDDVLSNFNFMLGEKTNYDNILEKVNVVWFRRWIALDRKYKTSEVNFPENVLPTKDNLLRLHDYLNQELKMTSSMFFRLFDGKFWLSHPRDIIRDKMNILECAKKNNLKVPPSLVTTRKKDLLNFIKIHDKVITKNIKEVQYFISDKIFSSTKTIEINNSLLSEIKEQFFPSLFQAMIPKEYELRVFYLDGEFYPMAIFSQLDQQTSVDFRNYNNVKPNRNAPYKLDKDICKKLNNLMNDINLKTGSIDLIKSTDGNYYFLEVNPVGQFGMTSYPCNYNLEEKIAKYLIRKDKEIEQSKNE